ncbi:hypothetical protein JTB14_026923 [Gonioctena quinquepunctata]|nr:hypothetical protein JTB14_026923 [Gonioctena quinquepunctata]
MRKVLILIIMEIIFIEDSCAVGKNENNSDLNSSQNEQVHYQYIDPAEPYHDTNGDHHHHYYGYKTYTPTNLPLALQKPKPDLQSFVNENPLAATLLLSSMLHLPPKYSPANHPELLPINPYIALLLSQYGRYVPHYGSRGGLYAYQAANNHHNNKPFGSYKIYEDND